MDGAENARGERECTRSPVEVCIIVLRVYIVAQFTRACLPQHAMLRNLNIIHEWARCVGETPTKFSLQYTRLCTNDRRL